MNSTEESQDIAVFWDFQNIGVKSGSSFAKDVLEFLNTKGRVVAAYAYADWKNSSDETASMLFRNRYELLHVPDPTKNSADVLMTAHAMAHLTSAPSISEYVLISKDYDFRPLVANLQRMGKRVVLICRPVDTNPDLLEMVDDHFDPQQLRSEVAETISEESTEPSHEMPADETVQRKSAFAQLQETVREIEERGNLAGIGYTKSVMTSLNPGFDESQLGFGKWTGFVGAAAEEGFVKLKGEGAGTIIKLPTKTSRKAKESLDMVQKGFEFLVRVLKKMEEEGASTELVHLASRMHSTIPKFNHANLGFRKFYDFVKAAEQRNLVVIEILPGKQPIVRTPDT